MSRYSLLIFVIAVYVVSGMMVYGQQGGVDTPSYSIGPPPTTPWEWPGYVIGAITGFFTMIFSYIGIAFQAASFSWIPWTEIRMMMSAVFGIILIYALFPVFEKIIQIIVEAIPL